MLKLTAKDLYLATLEREDCKKVWQDFEYDYANPGEELRMGHSAEKADEWFDEIQKMQGSQNVRLGIFLNDGTVIGDVALQDMDRVNRSCSIGMGIAKLANRSKGYGKQAVACMLEYGFCYLGMERITANTMGGNIGGQKSLERSGFVLEGVERKAVYLNGTKQDRMNYAILKEEWEEQQAKK